MKWLILQSDGVHKGQDGWEPNWQMRECYAIQHALEVMGDKADVWGLRHSNYATRPDFHSYDGIFCCENYEFDWLPHVNGCYRALRVYWIIDAHWQPLNAYADAIQGYDVVLHSTRGFIKPYQQLYPKHQHIYFPNGVDSRFFDMARYAPPARTRPLIFIGGKAAPRAAAIDRMIAEAGMFYGYGITGMKYVEAILNAKMVWNKGLNGDINYRNWEALGLGACLLTEYDPEMEALGLQHGVNCLFYRTIDEAIEFARLYTENGRWEQIGRAGYELAMKHTYIKRVEKMTRELFRYDLCPIPTLSNSPTVASATTSTAPFTR